MTLPIVLLIIFFALYGLKHYLVRSYNPLLHIRYGSKYYQWCKWKDNLKFNPNEEVV